MGKHFNEKDKITEYVKSMPKSHARAILHKHARRGYNVRVKIDRILVSAAKIVLGDQEAKRVILAAKKYVPEEVLVHRVPGSFGAGKRN
ncbi:MAG: hypothetical protein WCT19_00470 [Candidatus Paceibacterota bacterium]|jgi:hypothetical protein